MTRIEEPFVMFKKQKDEVALTGNDRFEGFCVDLLEQMSDQVGFKYIIELGMIFTRFLTCFHFSETIVF